MSLRGSGGRFSPSASGPASLSPRAPGRTDSMTTACANGSSSRVRSRSFSRMTSRDPLGLGRRGQEIVGEGRLPFRQVRGQHAAQPLDAVAGPGRDGHDLPEVVPPRELGEHRQQPLLGHEVDLVERQDRGRPDLRQTLQNELQRPDPAVRRRPRPGGSRSADVERVGGLAHHRRVQPVLRPVDPGRVDQARSRSRRGGQRPGCACASSAACPRRSRPSRPPGR